MKQLMSVAIQCQITVPVEADTEDVANHIAVLEVRERLDSINAEFVLTHVAGSDEVTF